MVKIKLPENLLTEEEKKELQQAVLQGGQIEKTRRSGCMIILIIPLIISITMVCLINFK